MAKTKSPPWSPEGKSPAELLQHAMGNGNVPLDRYQAAIIDTRGGMFRLQFGSKAMAKDQIAGLMSRLQSEKIIGLAVAAP